MIDEQMEDELDFYERGRLLKTTVNTPGWKEVLAAVKSYVDDMEDQLRSMPVGDPNIIPAHAGVHVMSEFYRKFQEDINRAVQVAESPTPELLEYLSQARRKFDVKAVMEANNTALSG